MLWKIILTTHVVKNGVLLLFEMLMFVLQYVLQDVL